MVALDAAILMHPRTWEASGHVESFTDPLVQCMGKCKKRWRADHLEPGDNGELRCPRVRRRAGRRAAVQPHVRDLHGPGARGRGAHLPAPRDRAGHLRELQERAPVRPPQAAVRHRADRQGVPQRDHARQLHLPHARVRADGDRVLRAAARGGAVAPALDGRRACAGTRTSASGPTTCSCASTATTSCRTTRPARATSSTCSRWAGRSSRASRTAPIRPAAPRRVLGRGPLLLRPRRPRSATSRT